MRIYILHADTNVRKDVRIEPHASERCVKQRLFDIAVSRSADDTNKDSLQEHFRREIFPFHKVKTSVELRTSYQRWDERSGSLYGWRSIQQFTRISHSPQVSRRRERVESLPAERIPSVKRVHSVLAQAPSHLITTSVPVPTVLAYYMLATIGSSGVDLISCQSLRKSSSSSYKANKDLAERSFEVFR